jgi:hypothetical protein
MLMLRAFKTLFASCIMVCALSTHAQDSKSLDASTLMIVDVHRHVQRWVSPSQLQAEMKELNIGWAGGVGAPYGPWDTQPYTQLLGNRYIATAGQVALTDIYRRKGVKGIEDASLPEYGLLIEEANRLFAAKQIKGLGELILNNQNSNPNSAFQRKAKIDSPAIIQLFEVAKRWEGFVNIHAEDDPGSVQELENIAAAYPSVPIILAHCLFTSKIPLIDRLLSKYPNMYCELSARNESMYNNQFAKQHAERLDWIVFDDKKLRQNWKELIEKHPTRFMVGTDTFNSWVDVKKAVRQIRSGLLQNLSPETAKLVASENAIRVMKLEP